jgi:transglutaminase-like putative cysteine protease
MDYAETPSARYHVIHETQYDYGGMVSLSHQMLHLSPRNCPWQQVRAQHCQVSPSPDWQQDNLDCFGNPVHWLGFETPHDKLWIKAEMDIEVFAHAPTFPLADSIAWDMLQARLSYQAKAPLPEDLYAKQFLFESTFVRIKHDFCDFGADCFTPGRPVLEASQLLMGKIFNEFTFDPEATTVSTPVLEVLKKKRGVCQDFAHLMLACLRSQGIPARYMSGYLLTEPPPGEKRLIGADASHAWVAVYSPNDEGRENWVEFDPTNNLLPNTQHTTLSWGRDFNDVSPLRGIILGGSTHEPEVAVTVMPHEEWEATPQSMRQAKFSPTQEK